MRILVIEDNQKTNEYLSTRLKAEKFAVDSAFDGKEGLKLACVHPYDLILLDISLPLITGKEIVALLRQKHIHIPIIIISAYASSKEIPSLLESGANDVVSKPFVFEELLARIHAILRRQKTPHKKPLIYKNVSLDYGTSCLCIDTHSIVLTRNEFLCIEILLQDAPKTVSRQEIFRYVWDTDANYLSNIVETHILNIRKKLSENGLSLIKTKPGKGYCIFI